LDRPDRAAKALGGLLVSQALEMTEYDRQAEPVGEPAQFLVELRPGFRAVPIAVIGFTDRMRSLCAPAFAQAPACGVESRPARDPNGDSIEPIRERISPPHSMCLPRQHQERRLCGILGVVTIAKNLPANVKNHPAVPLYQYGERRFGKVSRPALETIQQATVRERKR
jgi:hypothetical protein